MRAVGIKVLKNKLSEYVRLAERGETILVTDRDRVVAEMGPPEASRSPLVADAMLAEAVRQGWITPPALPAKRRAAAQSGDVLPQTQARTGGRPERALIYLDTSVALAHLLAEDRVPPEALWQETLISSRLIEYEIWTRIHARKLARSHGDEVRTLLGRIAFVELSLPVLARALEPFPKPVRTLDALHLASMDFVQKQGQTITLASYDDRQISTARALRFSIYAL